MLRAVSPCILLAGVSRGLRAGAGWSSVRNDGLWSSRKYSSRDRGVVTGVDDVSEDVPDSQDDGEGPLGPAATAHRLKLQAAALKDIQILHPLHGIFYGKKGLPIEFSPFLSKIDTSSLIEGVIPEKSRRKNSVSASSSSESVDPAKGTNGKRKSKSRK